MLTLEIPGDKKYELKELILDFNGTLAVDGKLIVGVKERIQKLSKILNIYVLTGDQHHNAEKVLHNLAINVKVVHGKKEKIKFINSIGNNHIVYIGNGLMDIKALKKSAIGICVIEKEGASTKALSNSDIVTNNILDALDLLLIKDRLICTLKR